MVAASGLKSNIFNASLDKIKRSYFDVLILATQTKQINIKKTVRRNFILSAYNRVAHPDQTLAIM